MSGQQLLIISNVAIMSAFVLLTLAMVFFASCFAGRRVTPRAEIDVRRATVAVGADAKVGRHREDLLPGSDMAIPSIDVTGDDPGIDVPDEPLVPVAPQPEGGRRAGSIAMVLTWLAFGVLGVGVVARAIWAGRAPWGNMFEFSVASALAALGVFLLISTRRDVRWFGVFLVPAVLLSLGLAMLVLYTESAQLVPALDSYWLAIHVSAAAFSSGAFIVAGLLAALYLVRDSADRRGSTGWAAKLPQAERLDMLSYRTIAFTMPLWTFAVVAGAIWAEAAWGRYWGWDPKETWALITWLIFAGYLHARATAGWRGRRAAWLAVIGLLCFVFNYFIVNFVFAGLHSYAGV